MSQPTKTPAPARATSGPITSAAGYDVTPLSPSEVEELAKSLSPDERRVLLYQGTESPFCGNLLANKKHGTYVCRLCALPLFQSGSKYESGTGWPSFYEPYDRAHVANVVDRSHGMTRTEIRCARCGGHLGHVFPDGPPPTGERYCLNSASLEFVEQGQPIQTRVESDRGKTATPPTKTEHQRKSDPIREP
jgi:peptide-methionine (R)-S-oxide reductase